MSNRETLLKFLRCMVGLHHPASRRMKKTEPWNPALSRRGRR